MAKEALKFKVGVFVLLGIIVSFVGFTWLGASKYLKGASTYAVYFDESVQGLLMNSMVKYRGVVIGQVDTIEVAPDSRLIEVVVRLEKGVKLDDKVVAQLSNVGITGIVFIELDRKEPGEPDQSPGLGFKPDYTVIPSRPSGISRLLTGIQEIYRKLSQVDFEGISDKLKATLAALEGFLSGERTTGLIARLDELAKHVDAAVLTVDKSIKQGGLKETVAETRAAMQELKRLIEEIRVQVASVDVGDTSRRVNRLVSGLNRRTRALTGDLRATTENMRKASEKLDHLLNRLKTTPSDLIFSRPPVKEGSSGE